MLLGCCCCCCWGVVGMLFGVCCGFVKGLWQCCWAVVVRGSCWDVVGVFWGVLLGVLVVVAVLVLLGCCGHLLKCSGV